MGCSFQKGCGRGAVVGCALAAVMSAAAPLAGQEVDAGELAGLVDSLRAEWGVPGAAVAVVRNDSVLLAAGFGTRDVGGGAPVDDATLFAIGSTTKAFTATAVAVLAGEGELRWDDRVIDHLPSFELADPWLRESLTVRDLLAHRSGLPMANLMWLTGQLDGDELIRRLRHLEPTTGFRSGLAYQNVLYLVAGRIVATVSGESWSDFIAGRLLDPVGMGRTRAGSGGLRDVSNVASPHVLLHGGLRRVPYRDIDEIAPAGAMLSSAADMARWLRLQLGDGAIDGRRVVAAEALAKTHRPQTLIPIEGPLAVIYPEATILSYAMGWVVSRHRDLTMLDHSGGIDGMTSLVALIPERNLGVAILTNLQAPIPPYWMLYPILDRVLGAEPRAYSDLRALADQASSMSGWGPARIAEGDDPRPPADYVGEYASEPIGSVRVRLSERGLVLEAGRMTATLEPWHFETFRVDWNDAAWLSAAGPAWVTFHRTLDGRVGSVELTVLPGEAWTFRAESGS